ncbi:hypothetical protein FRC19_005362 [Serendipita sp. 401]|nr:hypothetical protein FRC19_005362 [Serendipita sp. 401]KAG9036634.1 hypothetical protein FS842_003431 [Serendipita sp. 407]
MSTIAVTAIEDGKLDTFLFMKNGLGLLLPQLQLFESFEALSPMGSLADDMVTLFSTCERHIAEFSSQLCSKMQEYADLRASIVEVYYSSPTEKGSEVINKMNSTPSSISRCPDIILDTVFELIVEKGSHEILPLLTVSKRFHRRIMANPLLWRKIFIEIDHDLIESNSLSVPYINTCLERSRGILLDVVLDYSRCVDPHQFMRNYIYRMVVLATKEEEEQDRENILSHLDREFSGFDLDFGSSSGYPFYEKRLRSSLDIVRRLVGPEGAHAQRWRSAIISFGDTDNQTLWTLLSVEMPHLRSIRINQSYSSELDKILPHDPWPSLRELAISNMVDAIEIARAPVDFTVLTALEFCHDSIGYPSNFRTLSHCIALRELTIDCWELEVADRPLIEVGLPMLVSLTLKGKVDSLDYVRFSSAKLEHWILDCRPCKKFPDVNAVHVEWLCQKLLLSSSSFKEERGCLHRLLSSFTKTLSFTVIGLGHAGLCFSQICEMEKEKRLPDCLKLVEIEGAGLLDLAKDE